MSVELVGRRKHAYIQNRRTQRRPTHPVDEEEERAVCEEDEPAEAHKSPAAEAKLGQGGGLGPDKRVDAEDEAHERPAPGGDVCCRYCGGGGMCGWV